MIQISRWQNSVAAVIFTIFQLTNSAEALLKMRMIQNNFDFNSWANKIGENIQSKGIDLASFDGGLRGVIAREKIEGGVIMSIPAGLALQVTNNRPPSPFPKFAPQALWEKSMWDQRLALKLLGEIKNIVPSSKTAWFDRLPKSFSTPLHWSEDIILETQYKSLAQKVSQQNQLWKSYFNDWKQVTDSEYANTISLEDMVYALECVNSRAFSGVFEGSTAGERRSLFLFTGFLTFIWPLAGFGTFEQSLSASITVGISIIARDFFFSRIAGLKRYVICPCVDMFNHKSTCSSDVSYNYFLDQFELKTGAYNAGEQVFISYGKQSNDRLLQYYGFVENDNPNDIYDFGTGILELLLEHGDALAQEVQFPTNPSPSDRLAVIAQALRSTAIQDSKKEALAITTSDDLTTRMFRSSRNVAVSSPDFTAGTAPSSAPLGSIIQKFDDLTVRCLRLFFSSQHEWESIMSGFKNEQPTLDALSKPISDSSEEKVSSTLSGLVKIELSRMPTTLEQDIEMLQTGSVQKKSSIESPTGTGKPPKRKGFGKEIDNTKSTKSEPSGLFADEYYTALCFRIEKKKMLIEAI